MSEEKLRRKGKNIIAGDFTFEQKGMVQFTEISIQEINRNNGTEYTKADVIEMDIMQQLELAYLLYRPFTGRMHGLGDVYLGGCTGCLELG